MPSAVASSVQSPLPHQPSNVGIRFHNEEESQLLKVNLSDLDLPKVNNLHVDGLQRSWWARLFGK